MSKRSAGPGIIADKIRAAFQTAGEKIKEGFQTMGQGIKDTGQKAVQAVQNNVIKPIEQKVEQKIVQPIQQKVVAPIQDKVVKPVAGALDLFKQQATAKIRAGFQKVGNGLKKGGEKIRGGLQMVGGGLKKGGEKIKQGLDAVKKKITEGLGKMGKELAEGGRRMRAALKPQRRLSDAQRNVVKQVFKVFGELVGAVGCATLKLIPGANIAVEAICAAGAVAETAAEGAMAAKKKDQSGAMEAGKDGAKSVQKGVAVGEGAAKAQKAVKAVSILGKVSKGLRMMMMIPVKRKRSLEDLDRPALQRRATSSAQREKQRPERRSILTEGQSGNMSPRVSRMRLRRRQLHRGHRRLLELWRRQADETTPVGSLTSERRVGSALLTKL